METKSGFTKMTSKEFETYISNLKIARTILFIQQHHTYIPSYIHFKGNKHFDLQKGMKNTHININGWADIGQHFTIFPDGSILTGRSIEKSPACITGNNANAICIENLGNFDDGADEMTEAQRNAIVIVTAALCKKFSFIPDSNNIVYHHWFNLSSGVRNNGSGNNKSCPGTNFFGGNKVEDCKTHFIPLIKQKLNTVINNDISPLLVSKYVSVISNTLNIRTGAGTDYSVSKDRTPALLGSILRVYEEKSGWYRISSSAQHWVNSKYTKEVKRGVVNADVLTVRSGAGTNYPKLDSILKGAEVFVYAQKEGWSQISVESRWVKDSFLKF
jgi:uncharacterized protein YraI